MPGIDSSTSMDNVVSQLDHITDAALAIVPWASTRLWSEARRALERTIAADLSTRGLTDLATRYLARRTRCADPVAR